MKGKIITSEQYAKLNISLNCNEKKHNNKYNTIHNGNRLKHTAT